MRGTKRGGFGIVLLPMALLAQPASAEVVTTSENGFVVRVAAEVSARPPEAWRTLILPAQWWSSQHTFSGDAANLTLDPVVGGCFCEALPRSDGAPAAQKPGGVQHMRIVYIEPPRAMRLVGGVGPLQSEALAATLTMTVKPTDKGSRILFEYVVGGFMRYKVADIAPAVDRMLAGQLASLAGKLGPMADGSPPAIRPEAIRPNPSAGPPATDAELPPASSGTKVVEPLSGVKEYRLPPARGSAAAPSGPAAEAVAAPAPAPKPVAKAAARPPAASPPASKPAAKPPVKSVPKTGSNSGGKPAAKPAPNPDEVARRDANAAFDAALGGAPAR